MNNKITLDIKIQDELRKLFSQRGNSNGLKISQIALGDSDIDYNLSPQREKIQSFPAPFKSYGIKHKLVNSGGVNNVVGNIKVNAIKISSINDITTLSSLYNYPPDATNFTVGQTKPKVVNDYDYSYLKFSNTDPLQHEGYVVFIKTLIDNYYDENNKLLRLKETYTISRSHQPIEINNNGVSETDVISGWEFIYDEENNSFLIAKPGSVPLEGINTEFQILGNKSGITKILTIQI